MRLMILPAAFALLAACDARTTTIEVAPERTSYSRDSRTGLCFAALGRAEAGDPFVRAKSFSITSVPCSAEVLALVPRSQGGRL